MQLSPSARVRLPPCASPPRCGVCAVAAVCSCLPACGCACASCRPPCRVAPAVRACAPACLPVAAIDAEVSHQPSRRPPATFVTQQTNASLEAIPGARRCSSCPDTPSQTARSIRIAILAQPPVVCARALHAEPVVRQRERRQNMPVRSSPLFSAARLRLRAPPRPRGCAAWLLAVGMVTLHTVCPPPKRRRSSSPFGLLPLS